MCTRSGIRSVLITLLKGIEADAADQGEAEQDAADAAKAKRTLLEEYPPGTHPVLPEHQPYGLAPSNGRA